jgi:plasmid stabilization system protein ParE
VNDYRLAPQAAEDLQAIWEYIAADDLDAADRMIDQFFTAFKHLASLPAMGHKRQDLAGNRPLLFWPVGDYLIIYRATRAPIEIVAVAHGARDIPRILRAR